jgi:proline dehydrogenase
MLRQTILWLSHRQGLFRFVRKNALARRFAARFVAGETIDDAVRAVRALNARQITATLDLLGESVTNAEEARATADHYVELLDRIAAERLDSNVSVKLTAMGQDISDSLCIENITRVLERARQHGSFVRLDMEGSAYTERTLQLFEEHLYPRFPGEVGIVLQSYLRRTPADVANAVDIKCRVRLCKGAYKEPPTVAFPDKGEVDATYIAPGWPRTTRRSSTRPFVTPGRRGSPATASSSRCSMACGATCRTGCAATAGACASTCRTAPSGTPTSCAAWPSAPPTLPS